VPVVADVHADARVAGLEGGVAQVARLEEELLPEAVGVRDVVLAVLAQEGAVRVNHRRGVVVHARHLALVDGDDHGHLVLLRVDGQPLHGGAGHLLGDVMPLRVLRGTEVGAVEDLLQAENLDTALARLLDEGQVLVEHRLPDDGDGGVRVIDGVGALDETADDLARHETLLKRM
jgi:hypothetical protein